MDSASSVKSTNRATPPSTRKPNLYLGFFFFFNPIHETPWKYTAESGYEEAFLTTELNHPIAVTVDRATDIAYVAQPNKVRAYYPDGSFYEEFTALPASYQGIAVNSTTGEVYVANASGNKILVFPGKAARPT